MARNIQRVSVVLMLVVLALSSVALAKDKPIKLIFGSVYAVDHIYTKTDNYFKELVEKASNGQILVDYYPAGQLGSEREMLEATKTGAQQITQTTPGTLATLYPKAGSLELPYLFRDRDHYYKSMDLAMSLLGDDMAAKTGLRVVSWRERAPRHLTTNFPVTKLEDIKGLKIRVPEVPVRVAFWKALGANPIPLPMNEVYTALATGVIHAQENPLDTIYAFKLYEQQKYITLTEHMREISLIVMNEQTWKSLSSAQKKIITDAAKKSAEMANKEVHQAEEDLYKKLQELGVKINTIDKEPFMEKARTIWAQFGDKEIYEKIEAIK